MRWRLAGVASVLAAALAVGAVGCRTGARAPGPPPRNVLLVSIDTLRADYLGCYGDQLTRSETLDRLAAEGVAFESALAPVPITLPAHASLLTGLDPWRLGIRHNGIYQLEEPFETLAERLGAAGFETAAFVGALPLEASSGLDQGFDRYDDAFPAGGERYHNPERPASEVTDAALAWLARRPDPGRPFFLFLHYYDPHVPYEPPAEYMPATGVPASEEAFVAYRGEIAFVDDQLERLIGALREDRRLDQTLVVVTADHGEGLMNHGELTHGVFLYEELLRVPLIVRYPAGLPRGERRTPVVGLVDVVPTVLAALGLDPEPGLDGASLWELARGTTDRHRGEVFAESHFGRLEFGWAPLRALRTADWKYIDAPEAELYHLRDDPGERTNLAPTESDRAREMLQRIEAAFAGAAADLPQDIDEEHLERLQSLGYLQGSSDVGRPDDEQLPDPKHRIRQYTTLQLATFAIMQRRFDVAERMLLQILSVDPGNVTARCRLADARIARHDLDGAEQALVEALSIADVEASPQILWRLAGLEVRREDYERALELYREHASLAPLSAQTVERLTTVLGRVGRPAEAEPLLRAWLADNPASLTGWRAFARWSSAASRPEEAARAWRRVLELRPSDREAREALGRS